MATLREAFELRLFHADNSFCWNNEQDCVLRGFLATGEWVELLLGDEKAEDVMCAIAQTLAPGARAAKRQTSDWREDWIDSESLSAWPEFFEDLRDLKAFAETGIWRTWRLVERPELSAGEQMRLTNQMDVPEEVRSSAAVIGEFVRLAPETSDAPYDDLLRTRAMALARLKFDEGELLTPQELADLSGVSLKRVQNAAYEKSGHGPVINKQGRIEHDGAIDWLTRKGFLFSIWQQIAALGPLTPGWGQDVSVDPALLVNDELEEEVEEHSADYMFVPVAADRSKFLPDVRREGGYQIGPKGSEVWLANFFEALDDLAHQPTPRWRRPSEAGNWSIVSGVSWERVLRADLERAQAGD